MREKKALNVWEIGTASAIFASGAFITWQALLYPYGSVSQMGPGFVPVWSGITVMTLAAVTAFSDARSSAPAPQSGIRAILFTVAGILIWISLVERLGLVPASAGLVIISSLAERPFRLVATLLNAAALSAVTVLIFVYSLGMPLQPFIW